MIKIEKIYVVHGGLTSAIQKGIRLRRRMSAGLRGGRGLPRAELIEVF